VRILQSTGWQVGGKGGAAEKLGMPASTLRSRMKKLGIGKGSGPNGA
jgi:transcriptional regulator with GAF, ATPase, and Fis domain